nr:MAG TPA: hypothetical protein [Caudoviricetes sp.]
MPMKLLSNIISQISNREYISITSWHLLFT